MSRISFRRPMILGGLLALALIVSAFALKQQLRTIMPLRIAYFWFENILLQPLPLDERGNGSSKERILLGMPVGIDEDGLGNLYISDRPRMHAGRVIWKIDGKGKARIIAGTGRKGIARVDVPALQSNLASPEGLRVDGTGRVYFVDHYNHMVLRLEADGSLTRIAGTGLSGFNGDGIPAVKAQLNEPYDVAFDSRGNIYIADVFNNRIRKIGGDGIIHTFAGSGAAGYTGDNGPAIQAKLRKPYNVAVDSEDRVYIPDTMNHVIRRVDKDGIITTIAGVGIPGYSGDGGPATSAKLDGPQALAFDRHGNLLFDDEHNHAIRIIRLDGRISTLVGTGTAGYATDGTLAVEARLNDPECLLVRKDGTLLISDGRNGRILEVTDDGKVRNLVGRR